LPAGSLSSPCSLRYSTCTYLCVQTVFVDLFFSYAPRCTRKWLHMVQDGVVNQSAELVKWFEWHLSVHPSIHPSTCGARFVTKRRSQHPWAYHKVLGEISLIRHQSPKITRFDLFSGAIHGI
jgi:hypothetical protein